MKSKRTTARVLLRIYITVLLAACLAVPALESPARAQDSPAPGQPHLRLEILAEQEIEVTGEDGTKSMAVVPMGETVESGDVIVYTIAYVNEGVTEATDASVIDPIPEGTVYVIGSAGGENTVVSFSVDGGRSYVTPPVVTYVEKSGGTREAVPVPPEKYTHVKWLFTEPVQPGQAGSVTFKVHVK